MNEPKMILFDFFDTLVQFNMDRFKGNQAIMNYAVENPLNIDALMLEKEFETFFFEYREEGKLEVKMSTIYHYLFSKLKIRFSVSFEELENIFCKAAYLNELTPNIELLLKYLSQKKIRFGVISNTVLSKKSLEFILSNCMPSISFEFIIASSDTVFKKPHPNIFLYGLAVANLNKDEVWYVGDNFYADVLGANGIGMKCIWYNRLERISFGEANNYIEIKDYLELVQLLS